MSKQVVVILSVIVLIAGILPLISCIYATINESSGNSVFNGAETFVKQPGLYTAVIMIESFFSIVAI